MKGGWLIRFLLSDWLAGCLAGCQVSPVRNSGFGRQDWWRCDECMLAKQRTSTNGSLSNALPLGE